MPLFRSREKNGVLTLSVLAYDLGATSGRALIGRLTDRKLVIEEIHRFPNDPVQVGIHLHWDILRLFHEMKQGLIQAKNANVGDLRSLAIDSWAVDVGFLDKNGELLGNPYHYRDHHTDGIMEEVFRFIPREEIFRRTGIQFLQFNTIFQLYALKKADASVLAQAESMLMIPDLLRYFLTGERLGEFSNATTTQLYNPLTQSWDETLIEKLGLQASIFPQVTMPGTRAGEILPSIQEELGVPAIPVFTVAEHDTGSAVAAVPALTKDFAYLSCGTWSLMGTEVTEPVLTDEALELNFTNEGGVGGTYRLLKNIMGLWLLEECRRTWLKAGQSLSYEEMIAAAQEARPFRSLIDPDVDAFLNPVDMPQAIRDFCRETGQPEPQSVGETIRCILESLALKYRYVLEMTERLSGKTFEGLHMVGGGIKNAMLCQFTANALGKPVWAGPTEGSGIGNILVQYMALGDIQDIWEARSIVRDSFPIQTYEPQDAAQWQEAYERFTSILR